MTNDGTNTLVYDAENHATSAMNQSTAGAYVYDGHGLRVEKCVPTCTNPPNWTVYIFSGSKVIAEYDNGAVPTAPSREYIYGGGALLAKIDSTGTKYYHQDHLSNRLVTSSTGATLAQMGHYPFGDPWYNAANDKLVFTSYERDSESSNDYAQARFYRWLIGRFSALDPLSGSPTDPQTLNRYSYVGNYPVGAVDPTGKKECVGDPCSASLGGGSFFGGYEFDMISIDGVVYTPGQAASILEAGGGTFAVQCPNNQCVFLATTGQFVRYIAFGTGANYYAYSGPNAAYFSVQQAGTAAIQNINGTSISQSIEYAGEVYRDVNGVYSYDAPRPGDEAGSSTSISYIPTGTDYVADYHTHGGNSNGTYDDEHFSTPTYDSQGNYDPGDTGTNNSDALRYGAFVGGFLGTPGGRIQFYNARTGSITVLIGPPLP